MAVGVYTLKTLNDNWFEDRHQPAGSLSVTSDLQRRNPRPHETDIAFIGERFDVLSRISRLPARTSYALPEDGFNEKNTTNLVDFSHPRSRQDVATAPEKPALLSAESVPEISHDERRPLPGNRSGFGATLQRHPPGHDQRNWNTTHGDYFGEGNGRRRCQTWASVEDSHAGVSTAHEEFRAQGLKTGKLCGETLCESNDPGSDTRVQRAWLYSSDPALRHVHLGGKKPPLPEQDNELSLPLGDGAMNKVRKDLAERKGRLYRVATHITKGRGERSGVSIFQDG
mmetsp:Transcript_36949/g.81108  ORF Transcript_36949/g.81108 Transcript_36949/m.81108 type:complete len:284 (-) Transcript_36949:158-1009(-)